MQGVGQEVITGGYCGGIVGLLWGIVGVLWGYWGAQLGYCWVLMVVHCTVGYCGAIVWH